MGYLVIKDTGAYSIQVGANSLFTYNSDTTIDNPGLGYTNLKPFKFGFHLGVKIEDKADISNLTPRLSIGTPNSIPFTLNLEYDKTVTDRTTTSGLSPVDITESLIYLSKYAKKGTILLLYWMSNDTTNTTIATNTDIVVGQVPDYYSSGMRVLLESEWGLGGGLYPLIDNTISGSVITDYTPYTLPIMINDITVQETAGENIIIVGVTGFVVGKE